MSAAETRPTRTLLILGASGDLTGRLLLPGFARLVAAGRAEGVSLVGAGNDDWSDQRWQQRVREAFAGMDADPAATAAGAVIADSTTYRSADVTAEGALAALLKELDAPVAVYFALPPAITERACQLLRAEDLPEGTRLVLEKPFGSSEETARQLNQTLATLVPEDRIHRVDHFLGKSTVLNVLGLRFANRLLEPLWNSAHVEKVEIVFDEALGLEGRARYYDTAGALRDMLQSHLLQVLALLAMEPPATLSERDVRDGKAQVLRATRLHGPVQACSRRARWTAGRVDGRELPDYTAEDGVDPDRQTETLAEVELEVRSWRWAGVPFVLRSGKAIGCSRKEAVVTFRPVPHLPDGFRGSDTPTRLVIGFGPDVLRIELDVNGPGDPLVLDRTSLETTLNGNPLLPYGEVLDGVLAGDPLLSVRADVAEECWRVVAPVLEAWRAQEVPLEEYPAGSTGPEGWATNRS